ncbi:hypothetical protein OR221_0832 [Microbacterium laevaniformans OR221]|nr:hypothetical protein OR221_0832 [Microbacterium laevaniformans OR221]
MRILTVRQPWAWAIIHGGKDVENRVRNIAGDYRGPVAIHVAREIDTHAIATPSHIHPEFRRAAERYMEGNTDPLKGSPWMGGIGHIIGVVDLVDVHSSDDCFQKNVDRAARLYNVDKVAFDALPDSGAGGIIGKASFCSPWALDEHQHLCLENPCALAEPIQYKGALGLRTIDADTIALIESRLS